MKITNRDSMLQWNMIKAGGLIMQAWGRVLSRAGLVLLVAITFSSITAGIFTPLAAASIAQGYTTTDSDLVTGMAASLSPTSTSDNRVVERATTSNKAKFVGIVTTKDANLVTLTSGAANIVVATTGEATAFASDANGGIKKGDYLAVSPLKGILMHAGDSEPNAIGTALEDLSLGQANSQQIDTSDGKKTVHVATIRVEISPSTIALASSNNESKSFLKTLGQGIIGRSVSEWQVLSALIIFTLILIIEGSMVYGAIHSTIIALGRNPLAHEAVYKQLFQVLLAALGILAFGMAVIYAVLQF